MSNSPTAKSPLSRAIDCFGSVVKLAQAINVAASAPSMWHSRGRIPAEHCPAIERATGGAVRCEELRPDIPWGVLREQVATEGAPAVPAPEVAR